MDKASPDDLLLLRECSEYGHVMRQAIFVAIKKGRLKATKVRGRWVIRRGDYDAYRADKYNRDIAKIGDEYVFDAEKGHFSLRQIAKVFSVTIGVPYSVQRLYYLVRTGQLPAFRKGVSWVVLKEDAIKLLETEMGESQRQMKFI